MGPAHIQEEGITQCLNTSRQESWWGPPLHPSATSVYVFRLLFYMVFLFLAIYIFFCNCCCQLFMLHIFSASTWLVFSLLYDEETFLILMESNLSLCFYSYWSLRRKDNLNISKNMNILHFTFNWVDVSRFYHLFCGSVYVPIGPNAILY